MNETPQVSLDRIAGSRVITTLDIEMNPFETELLAQLTRIADALDDHRDVAEPRAARKRKYLTFEQAAEADL